MFGGPRSRHYVPASPEDSYHPFSDTVDLVNAFNENPYNFDTVSESPARNSYQPSSGLHLSSYDTTPEYFENRDKEKPHVSGFGVNEELTTETSHVSNGMAELVDPSFGEYETNAQPSSSEKPSKEEYITLTTQASVYPNNEVVVKTESSVNSEVYTELPKENVSVSA